MSEPQQDPAEPLPIWFFVGLILSVYGVLVTGAGLLSQERTTVLAETRPGLWWGLLMLFSGGVFVWIGWRGREAP